MDQPGYGSPRGKIEQAAEETAALWRKGPAEWDIEPERLQRLKESVRFAVYTPGSTTGLPLSILASLEAPDIPWAENSELLREQISGTVTALLGLIGLKDIDPVQSREHILLSNIFENAWSKGHDLDLGELIMQAQSPPFDKLGVLDINRFFPESDRFALAMRLNSILAAPAFQSWLEGDPLDVARLLYDENGEPRHTVFYIAHLSDEERMFFVTLLSSAVEGWMRTQAGTTTLRALVYFDEIFGYLPPVGNPPSKEPMLRMLKQARAFGVGLVLATQNPVDVDYKALSNAGSWFIGKLGTDQDKQRLLDGLASATPGGLDRAYDHLISAIGKRVFLMRNVHEKQPVLFGTRWAMNYLAGPLTRAQIPALNELAGATAPTAAPTAAAQPAAAPQAAASPAPAAAAAPAQVSLPGTASRPRVPGRTNEYFLPNNLTLSQAERAEGESLPLDSRPLGLLYRPVLLAQADVRFLNRKYNVDYTLKRTALVVEPDRRGSVRWQEHTMGAIDARSLESRPAVDARFESLDEPLSDEKVLRSMESDFQDWVYRDSYIMVRANEGLGVTPGRAVRRRVCAAMLKAAPRRLRSRRTSSRRSSSASYPWRRSSPAKSASWNQIGPNTASARCRRRRRAPDDLRPLLQTAPHLVFDDQAADDSQGTEDVKESRRNRTSQEGNRQTRRRDEGSWTRWRRVERYRRPHDGNQAHPIRRTWPSSCLAWPGCPTIWSRRVAGS